MKDDPVYTPSDCFDTFPFPARFEGNATLAARGKVYCDFRATLMIKNDQGLTATYNRFHDPDERDPEIQKLRELHAAMDRAVLDAYGWTDLQPRCEFLLDYAEETAEDDSRKRRKKPYRYRWPDEIRDEVLTRLLTLNAERAAQEKLLGDEAKIIPLSPRAARPIKPKGEKRTAERKAAKAAKKKTTSKRPRRKKGSSTTRPK